MRAIVFSTVIAMVLTPAVEAGAEPRLPEKVQAVLESWLTERAPVEESDRHRRLCELRRSWSGDRGLRG